MVCPVALNGLSNFLYCRGFGRFAVLDEGDGVRVRLTALSNDVRDAFNRVFFGQHA